MRTIIFGILFTAINAFAQQPVTGSTPEGWKFSTSPSNESNDTATFTISTMVNGEYASAHDFSVKRIREYQEYMEERYKGFRLGPLEYISYGNSPDETVKVDNDGNVTFQNITPEDAFLLVYSNELNRILDEYKDNDRRLAIEASVPPKVVKFHQQKYKVHNIPDWSNGADYGDTTCALSVSEY